MKPQERRSRRRDHLLVSQVADDFIVVDETTGQAHALTGPAARVWQALDDGDWSAITAAERAAVLVELDELGLIASHGLSRRVLLQTGAGAVASLGILSVALPSAAMASSTNLSFTTAGLHQLTIPGSAVVQYTLIGGGGGKGGTVGSAGGNGGSGNIVNGTITNNKTTAQTLTIFVGAGGIDASGSTASLTAAAGEHTGGVGGAGATGGGGGGGGGSSAFTDPNNDVILEVGGGGGGGGGFATGGTGGASGSLFGGAQDGTSATALGGGGGGGGGGQQDGTGGDAGSLTAGGNGGNVGQNGVGTGSTAYFTVTTNGLTAVAGASGGTGSTGGGAGGVGGAFFAAGGGLSGT